MLQLSDDRDVGQGVDTHRLPGFIDRFGTRDSVCAVNVHTAGAANSLRAGTPECESRIDIILNPDQRVQDHRAAVVPVYMKGVHCRIDTTLRVPPIYFKHGGPACTGPALPDTTLPLRRLSSWRDSTSPVPAHCLLAQNGCLEL